MLRADAAVLLGHGRVLHPVEVPVLQAVRVHEAAAHQGADEIQRQRGALVAAQHQLRIGLARRRGELGTVDQVAAIARQRDAVARFEFVRARLGVLAGEPAHADHRLLAAVDQHQAHLQQDFELVGDGVRVAVIEALRAIAALQQKPLAARGFGQLLLERSDLPGRHQRRQLGDLATTPRDLRFGRGIPAAGRRAWFLQEVGDHSPLSALVSTINKLQVPGEFIENGPWPGIPGHARVKGLEGHFDPLFRSFDLDYSDQRRADRFIAELKRFESQGEMPRLIILRLPNDHTSGTKFGAPTPTAYVADNDLALGRVVEAVSHGKFWKETAIFVLEDDAQNGPDHVDAHRSPALVVSPYTKRRHVDSSMYSTSSMLRTMELILGLKPMTQFDAAAQPMYGSFQAAADLTPFMHLPAGVSLDECNAAQAWGAADSAKMDFREADAADEQRLNEIIWRSVRGADHPMPPPVRAAFFVPHGDRD